MPLVCPQCRTPLRVADSSHLEKPFDCPECSTLLVYESAKNEVVLATTHIENPMPTVAEPVENPVVQESFEEKLNTIRKKSLLTKGVERFNQLLKSPLAFLWIMASVFLLLFVLLVIAPIFSQRQIEIKKLQAELDRSTKEEIPLAPEKEPELQKTENQTSRVIPVKPKTKEEIPTPNKPEEKKSIKKTTKAEPAKKAAKPELPEQKKSPEMNEKPEPKKEPPPAKPIASKKPKYTLPDNLNERFAQKIVRFQQTNPVSLQELLVEMEVLLEARIEPLVGDSPITKKLEKTDIRIDLKETTVREILTEILKRADLTFRVGKDRIHIESLE